MTRKKNSPVKSPETGLAPMQEAFVLAFVSSLNASQAAKEAGYSEDTAGQLGYQLLQNPSIKSAIQEKLKEKFTRLDMTAERILLEMFRLATVDISGAFDSMGQLKPLDEIPEDCRRAIVGLEVAEIFDQADRDNQKHVIGLLKKVKFADKSKALEMMGKYFKLLTDQVEIKDATGIAARLAAAKKRKAGKA